MDRIGAPDAAGIAEIIASYSTSELKEAKVTILQQAGSELDASTTCLVRKFSIESERAGHGMRRALFERKAPSPESILKPISVTANSEKSDQNKRVSLLVRFIPIINTVLSSRGSTSIISPSFKTESDRAGSPTKASASSAESPRGEDLISVLLKI